MYDLQYEVQTDRLLDCVHYTGPVECVCEVCKNIYPENLLRWRSPHENATDVWVCSEDCAREWCEYNHDEDEIEEAKNG